MAGGNRCWKWPGKGKDTGSSRQSDHSATEHDEHESQANREVQQIAPRLMRAPMGTPHFLTHPVSCSEATQVPETQQDSEEPLLNDGSPQSDRSRSRSTSIPDSSAASHRASRSRQTDRRIHLTIDKGSLCPAHEVGQSHLQCFETKWFPEGWCWKKLTNRQHHFYFEEFKKRFYWDDGLDSVVYKLWYKKASKRYSDTITKTRTDMMKKKMSNEIWAQWELVWQSEAFRKIREANSKNRRSEHTLGAGMSTHACGSQSIDDHKNDLVNSQDHF